jgi:hypothetical protein
MSEDEGPLADAELRALRDRARETGDEELRRLVASYLTLRRLAAEMVALIETREGGATIVRTPLFGRIRDLTRRP